MGRPPKRKKGERGQMTLAALREASGLTQKELGDRLGVTDQTVSNWEKGRSFPRLTVPQVAELLAALPCTFSELVEICQRLEREVKEKQGVDKA